MRKKKFPKGAASVAASGSLTAQIVTCKGQTKVITRINGSRYWNRFWYNSCDTKAIITAGNSIAVTLGVVAGVAPETAPVTGVAAALIAIGVQIVSYYADISNVDSVIVSDHWQS